MLVTAFFSYFATHTHCANYTILNFYDSDTIKAVSEFSEINLRSLEGVGTHACS